MQNVGKSGSKSCWEESSEFDTGRWIVNKETKAGGGEIGGCVPKFLFCVGSIDRGTVSLFS